MTEQPPSQQPPQQPPQAPPPPGPAYAPAQPQNGMAIAALVLGILAIVFVFIFFPLAFVLGLLAIIFGIIGRRRADENPAVGRKGMATAGLVTGILGILLALIISVIIGTFISSVDESDFEIKTDIESGER